jgi:crossover junction endodeoxyribonuclease RuvC
MKHKTLYIGIDPGKNGGISAINDNGEIHISGRMPETPSELVELLRDIQDSADVTHCILELVRSSPQMGVTSSFTFGQGFGRIESGLAALCIPYEEIWSSKWQRAMGCLTKGDKNVTKAKASTMFPGIKVTHAIADSLLLAEYCRRQQVGGV